MGKLHADWSRVSHARANAADSSFSLFFSVTQSCVVNELKSERFSRETFEMEQKPFIVNGQVARNGQQPVQGMFEILSIKTKYNPMLK